MISILQGTSKEGTSDVPIRVLEIPLDDGTKEYLATNLFDPAVTKDMFRELYFYRWPVELKYKELKSRFAMEEFSGATAVSIQQEFYINMLLSNLASLIKMKQMKKYRFLPKAQISSVIRPIVHLSLDGSKVLFPKYSADCLSFQLLNSYIKMLYVADHSFCPEGHFQGRN